MFSSVKIAAIIALLSGCGALYTSPRVLNNDPDIVVQEVEMTAQVVYAANQNAYQPLGLPGVFTSTASGTLGGGGGAVPLAPLQDPVRTTSASEVLPAVSEPIPYVIGVGDELSVRGSAVGTTGGQLDEVVQNLFIVQSDGTIDLPGIGSLPLGGATMSQANSRLRQALVQNRIDPGFSIQVEEFNSQRVSLGGAFVTPQVISLGLPPLYLEEALVLAGGPAEGAQDGFIRLYRDGSLYQMSVSRVLDRSSRRILLMDGDSIFLDPGFDLQAAQDYFQQEIQLRELRANARATALSELQVAIDLTRSRSEEERSNFERRVALGDDPRPAVYIVGEVANPRAVPVPFGQDLYLADVLLGEGGVPIETGDFAHVYVLRRAEDGVSSVAYRLDARNVVNLILAAEFELRPRDIIFVAEQRITRWNRALAQSLPSVLSSAASGL